MAAYIKSYQPLPLLQQVIPQWTLPLPPVFYLPQADDPVSDIRATAESIVRGILPVGGWAVAAAALRVNR